MRRPAQLAAIVWLGFVARTAALGVTNVTILHPPRVNQDDLQVTRVHRVSSPFYQTGNTFHSEGDPFNRDATRLLFLELDSAHRKAPLPARGMVTGKITDLLAWRTFDEYRRAAKPVGKAWDFADTPEFSFHWSRHAGEEHILYTLRKSRKMIVRLNVETPTEEDVVSYDPGDGRDTNPRLCGWTTDDKLLVVMQDRNAPTYGGGFEVDVLRRTRTPFAQWPQRNPTAGAAQEEYRTPFTPQEFSDHWRRYQKNNLGSGHAARSPAGRFALVNPGISGAQGVVDTVTGQFYPDDWSKGGDAANRCAPFVPNYCNWNASEHWYVMNAGGEQGVNGKPAFGTQPEIHDFPVWQVHFLGPQSAAQPFAYRKLFVVRSSSGWYDARGQLHYMEPSRVHVNVSRDARWLYFVATDGNFHEEDLAASASDPRLGHVRANWSTCGVFLAECSPASP
ncbi:MAG: hypothetical protein EBS84_13865 [Proteobacteria bacterium]|nr:hypothetical protein [Verrucomicrobiota bacterium]NBU10084.1 hypothetical protein [Pseudomonadota bacterium]